MKLVELQRKKLLSKVLSLCREIDQLGCSFNDETDGGVGQIWYLIHDIVEHLLVLRTSAEEDLFNVHGA